jgi:electron transport complex protein RnfC
VVETKYPQGAEKMLIKALLNREVPSGGLPFDVGVAVFNVATLAQIGDLLPRRQGLIERVVTVAGPGVNYPGNYLMALGTPLGFVLEHAGLKDNATEILLGGPMMGMAVDCLELPITKGVTGIVVLTDEELVAADGKMYPCIRCGACVEACPIHLNPSRLGLLARRRLYDTMETAYHLNDCFECGCCAYVCPSNIPLVQYFRVAKAINRQRKASACQ